ncbi:Retrovirus-related Pol polyprotein LINE-1 [Gossypium australe]|uniref:Retrovirus-related Pol polyprotein LINE-1 n=1 Tax=Gossypium australe TaxID=47621 RepID=A0A5B6UXL5_9ROSI|nr:Retrovirus-related Pol polyprotein LINE-1 [Gossypium australe]
MEWLGWFIRAKMDISNWDPIRLSRTGPAISHLFFVDDLVIFYKARLDQTRLLDSILTQFCEISGHILVLGKVISFFPRLLELMSAIKLINYSNSRNSRMLALIWLSIAGRITLAQSVLFSTPNYFMQSLIISKDGYPKMSLVGWESICQPRARGGLSFRHLNDQNSSLGSHPPH